ncbi:hypothetical protein M3J09_009458 [Ascochyta lentis]
MPRLGHRTVHGVLLSRKLPSQKQATQKSEPLVKAASIGCVTLCDQKPGVRGRDAALRRASSARSVSWYREPTPRWHK